MINSMTGFGRHKIKTDEFAITVEMRSVNHRFLEFQFRMPKQFFFMEDKIKRKIGEEISRGRIEVYVTIEGTGHFAKKVVIDWNLLDEYIEYIKIIEAKYNLQDKFSLKEILLRDDIMTFTETPVENETITGALMECIEGAVSQLKEMRIAEGRELRADIERQIQELKGKTDALKQCAPQVVHYYAMKLKKRMEEFTNGELDETRLLNEVAVFADKADINEELTRLHSHFEQFEKALELSVPVGRKLDFLVQEMNREVNTIGSKGNDTQIAREVVEMKAILEKIKEQVQNIE